MGKAFSNIKDGWDFDHVFTFGKYAGSLVDEVIEDDPGYILWMIGNTESMFTKAVIVDAIRQDYKLKARAKAEKSRATPYDGLGFKNSYSSTNSNDLDDLFDDVPF